MAPTQKKRVCIIGAGASGLPSIRHALLYDCDVTCYEATNSVGGLWNYKTEETDEASVMKTTVINTSKELTAYSDFPPPAEAANFMHNTKMFEYLDSYANNFGLKEHIKFNTKVLNVERSETYKKTGQWKITYAPNNNLDDVRNEIYDAVLVCTGHHAHPYFPQKWPGQDTFTGKTIHSHSYKDHRGFEDRTVVVVGVGNSGGDIAVELSRIAKQVYLVTRRGTWIYNRIYDFGEPFDFALNTRFVFGSRQLVPSALSNWFVEQRLQRRFDHAKYGLKPKHHIFSQHPTVNDELPNRIACGTVRVKPNIKKFKGNTIEFEDGSFVDDVDDLILSTGYSFSFPQLENGKLISVKENEVELYKYMFPLNVEHNTLAVIGLIQPLGSVMPISEMQARVFLDQFTGGTKLTKLPSREEMCTEVCTKREEMAKRYVASRRHTIQVDYLPFMEELGALIGCKPDLKALAKEDIQLALRVVFGPNVPYCYRLQGPHKWNGARDAIMTAPERIIKATNPHYNESILDQYVNYSPLNIIFGLFLAFVFYFLI